MLLHWGSFIGPYPLITIGNVSVEWACHARLLLNKFKCDLCDAGYVGFTNCHQHQRVQEKRKATSLIGKHFGDKHSLAPRDLTKNFRFLEKCTKKLDCLLYEMFLFKN